MQDDVLGVVLDVSAIWSMSLVLPNALDDAWLHAGTSRIVWQGPMGRTLAHRETR